MRDKSLYFKDINPHVRSVNLLQCKPGFVEGPRKIYDHQFIYVHKGIGWIQIAEKKYPAKPGDLFLYGAGVLHTFIADNKDPYLLSGIHFDFTQDFNDLQFPIGPFGLNSFNEELKTESINFKDFLGFPEYIELASDTKIRKLIYEMVDEFEYGRIFNQDYVNSILKILLIRVARYVLLNKISDEFNNNITESVIDYIQENFTQNLTNENIALKFHFNHNYLNHLMVAHTGVTLRQYLIDFRLRKAMDMLIHTDLSTTNIAKAVGYEDVHYFSRLFKKKTGLTPRQIHSSKIVPNIT